MYFDIENKELKNLQAKYKELKNNSIPMSVIKLFGIGGAGCNILGRFKKDFTQDFENIILVSVNTDIQSLHLNQADIKIQIGEKETKGNGAGARPSTGERSAKESLREIRDVLEGTDLLFLTCGMGGGTGTGATPVIAQLAKEMNIKTIAIVVTPHKFEGGVKMKNANEGLKTLKKFVDILITVSNDKLVTVYGDCFMSDVYANGDLALKRDILSVSDLILNPGQINLDFADVSTIISDADTAHIGIGTASGESAMYEAVKNAMESPLLETNVENAQGLIVGIACDQEKIKMAHVTDSLNMLSQIVSKSCNTIWGLRDLNRKDCDVEVTLIATTFNDDKDKNSNSVDIEY